MKKLLKALLVIILIVVIAVGGAAAYINFRGIPTYKVEDIKYTIHSTPEKVARGRKLVSMLCYNCHMNFETGRLTGKEMKEAPQFGFLYSQNITHDKEYGIGTWTDAQIYYLLRTGIKRDGKYAPPYMAKLPYMADEDVESIIAFLRSDDPLVAAAAVPDKPCEPSFLTKFLCTVAFKPLPLPEKEITIPDSSDKLAFGKYMTLNLDCWTCHSKAFDKLNIAEPEKTPGYLGGGNPITDEDQNIINSANLTSDATGIGSWSEEKFVKALKTGTVDNRQLRYPMLPYTQLTDYEASAIFTYLKSVPPIKNEVDRKFSN